MHKISYETIKHGGACNVKLFLYLSVINLTGSADYFGLAYYATSQVGRDTNVKVQGTLHGRDYPTTDRSDPRGLRQVLGVIRHRYNNFPVAVSGNGVWDGSGDLKDDFRAEFIEEHVDEVLKGRSHVISCLPFVELTFIFITNRFAIVFIIYIYMRTNQMKVRKY